MEAAAVATTCLDQSTDANACRLTETVEDLAMFFESVMAVA